MEVEHADHRAAVSSGLQFQLHPVSLGGSKLVLGAAACVQPPDRRLLRPPRPLPLQLVLINISDHHTRTRANAPAGSKEGIRVLGCLLGQQAGRVVDISNSFEMRYREGSSAEIDEAFLHKKMEQCEWQEGRPPGCLQSLHPRRQPLRAARGPASASRRQSPPPLPAQLIPPALHCPPPLPLLLLFLAACRQADLSAAGRGGVVCHRRRHQRR